MKNSAELVRIAVCSDTHFWPGSNQCFGTDSEQLQPWSEDIQATFLEQIRTLQPDLLLHLGDYTCGGGVFQMPADLFYATLRNTHDTYRSLGMDYYGLPGNHDCPAGTADYSFCEQLLDLEPGRGYTVDTPLARLVLLHAQGHSPLQKAESLPNDPVYGWVAEAELARLDEALATAGERPVLLFCHQLLRPWSNGQPWRSFYAIQNADAVLAIMARYGNVGAVFQGHAHMLDVHVEPVGTRSVCFVVAPALILYPLGWLLLTLTDERLRIQLQQLPLPELIERSRVSGEGQDWRLAPSVWPDFTIAL